MGFRCTLELFVFVPRNSLLSLDTFLCMDDTDCKIDTDVLGSNQILSEFVRQSSDGLSISIDEVFELLSSQRRRDLILELADRTPMAEEDDTYVEIRDLSVVIACKEYDVDPGELSSEQRHRVYVSITQNHGRRLDECGIVEYYERVKKLGTSPELMLLADIVRTVEAAVESG